MCTIYVEAKKNQDLYLVFPMIAVGTGNFATGKSPADDAYYKDGAGSWTSLAIDDAASEIGSTGMYELDLVAAEVNHDQVVIKLTAASVDDLMIVINTVPTPAQLADGVAHGGTLGSSTATLALNSLNVSSDSGNAVTIHAGTGGRAIDIDTVNQAAIRVLPGGDNSGIIINSEAEAMFCQSTGAEAVVFTSSNSNGLRIHSSGTGTAALYIEGTDSSAISVVAATIGVEIDCSDSSESAIVVMAGSNSAMEISTQGSGSAIDIRTGISSSHGIYINTLEPTADGIHIESGGHGVFTIGGTDGDGIHAVGQGTGTGIVSDPIQNVKLADGVAHGGTLGSSTATLALKHVNVTNSSNHAVQLSGLGSGLEIIGTGDTPALNINNSGTGNGCHITSNGGDAVGLVMAGAGAGAGLILLGSESGPGLEIDGPYTTPGPALVITTDSGNYNGSVGGDAISLVSTDGQAITLSPEQWLTKLSTSAGTMVIGTVDNTAHTPTTTVFQADDITEANADQFFERLVIFTGGTLARQAREILSYSLVGGRGQFTLKTALTGAPANDDPFIVV